MSHRFSLRTLLLAVTGIALLSFTAQRLWQSQQPQGIWVLSYDGPPGSVVAEIRAFTAGVLLEIAIHHDGAPLPNFTPVPLKLAKGEMFHVGYDRGKFLFGDFRKHSQVLLDINPILATATNTMSLSNPDYGELQQQPNNEFAAIELRYETRSYRSELQNYLNVPHRYVVIVRQFAP
jgi:hypothetical protein